MPGFVRVTLKDGQVVGGWYGSASFAAYAKDGRDLYLEQRWVLDSENHWFQEPANDTLGVWISTTEAVAVEFYTGEDATTTDA